MENETETFTKEQLKQTRDWIDKNSTGISAEVFSLYLDAS